MEKLIRRILRESHLEKVQKTLDKYGLASTLKMFGMDAYRLSQMLDMSEKELLEKYNPFETIFTDEEFENSLFDTMTWMKDRPNIFYPRLKNNPINEVIKYIIEITIDDFHSKLVNFNTTDWEIPETPKLLYLRYGDLLKNNSLFKKLYSQYGTDKEEMSEYARTLKNARKQGSGLRFSKSAIKANPNRFRPYSREQIDERIKDKKITCECGWSWKLKDGGNDPYTCHKCGNDNSKKELTEKCWKGYTQKGMKTMFGKKYPNCVKKTNIKEDTNKKLSAYQKLVDNVVTDLKYQCNELNSEGIHTDTCDFIEALTEVKVVDITRDNTIQLKLKYKYFRYMNEDEFVYELKLVMKKYGVPKIEVIESTNIHNRQF